MIFLSILIIFFIAQQFRLFLQWLFVSGRPCSPQTYGVGARNSACRACRSLKGPPVSPDLSFIQSATTSYAGPVPTRVSTLNVLYLLK